MLAIVKTDLNCVKSTQVEEKSSFAYFKTTEYIKIIMFCYKTGTRLRFRVFGEALTDI